ncbi:MAG: hypothetical protein JNK14_05780 [Chitinophagaceae bacterium]|nr:hypothetical protein [Chitinophagaceae bacterium]
METVVLLSCEPLGITDKPFGVTHAQRILDKESEMKVSNWMVTDPQFTVKNGIIIRANKDTGRKTGVKATH